LKLFGSFTGVRKRSASESTSSFRKNVEKVRDDFPIIHNTFGRK